MSSETNGSSEKTPGKIEQLHQAWVKAGAKDPPEAVSKKQIADYKNAIKAKLAAEKALAGARRELSLAVETIILNHGKGRLRIGGEVCIPMSRRNDKKNTETLFFRGEGKGEVKDLG